MPEQLGFDLPSKPALGRTDFLVAPSNAIAIAMIENWQSWSGGKFALSGPDGSGKTHLAHVWAAMSNARVVAAEALAAADIPMLAQGCVAIEDVPKIAGNPSSETALFHLHNLAIAEGNALLFTGRGEPLHWGLALPDLASRIASCQTATLDAPDDALLAAILAKLFSDRQIMPKTDVIPYLLKRIERSFSAAREVVALLDAASLAQQRSLTRSFVATTLDKNVTDKS